MEFEPRNILRTFLNFRHISASTFLQSTFLQKKRVIILYIIRSMIDRHTHFKLDIGWRSACIGCQISNAVSISFDYPYYGSREDGYSDQFHIIRQKCTSANLVLVCDGCRATFRLKKIKNKYEKLFFITIAIIIFV